MVTVQVYPSPRQREAMLAFLNGYTEAVTVVELELAVAAVRNATPAPTHVDGMIVSQLLRRLGFNRDYGKGVRRITYRRAARP